MVWYILVNSYKFTRMATCLRPKNDMLRSFWFTSTSRFHVNSANSRSGFRRGLLLASVGLGSICILPNAEKTFETGTLMYSSVTRFIQDSMSNTIKDMKVLLASFITTRAEARVTQEKLVEIVKNEPQTVTQSIKSSMVISVLVLSCTAILPAIFISSMLLPFVYGLKQFALFVLFFSTLHAIPVRYSRSFVESEIMTSMWRTASLYFSPFRVLRPAASFDNSKNYVFALHPHGRLFIGSALILGLFHSWFPELWKNQTLFAGINDALFLTPVLGKFMELLGAVSVSRASVNRVLGRGDSIMIVPGGIEEVLEGTYDDREVLYLAARKGFCRVAMQHGAGLVPCFCFGESSLFQHDSRLRSRPHLPRQVASLSPASGHALTCRWPGRGVRPARQN
jgi:hypothetical protein